MKKLFILLICILLTFSSVGCSRGNNATVIKKSKPTKEVLIEIKGEDQNLIADNKSITKIYAKHSDDFGFYIEFNLTNKGKKLLAEYTENNIGKSMSVCINNTPYAIADIVAKIDSGRLCLPSFSTEEELIETFNILIEGFNE